MEIADIFVVNRTARSRPAGFRSRRHRVACLRRRGMAAADSERLRRPAPALRR
jgi:hypothetical protein